MTVTRPFALLFLAIAPAVLLIIIGVTPFIRNRAHAAIPATTLATGVALLVLVLLVIGAHGFDAAHGAVDSRLILFGLPLVCFATAMGVQGRSGRLSLLSLAAGGVVGIVGLWWLGGFALMLPACSFGSGGC